MKVAKSWVMTFMTFCKNIKITFPSCTLLSGSGLGSPGSRTSSLRDWRWEWSSHRGQLVRHMSRVTTSWPCSQYWYGNQEQVIHCKLGTWARRGSVGQAGKSVESEIELNIWHSCLCSVCPLNSLLSVQVGFSLPSPDFPLVSGVDNPVGDTAQSSPIFAFNWRLTSTYSEPTFVFRWLLGLTHDRSGFHLAIHSPTLGSSAHLMHSDCINFQVTNSIILNFPAFSVACQPN